MKHKLRRQILPYVESAKLLRKQWFYLLHRLFGVVTDLTVALATVGVSGPILTAIAGPPERQGISPSIVDQLPREPKLLYYTLLVLILSWILLRLTFTREGGQTKAVLVTSCCRTMAVVEANLHQVLATPNPMPALIKLDVESIRPTVERNMSEKSWPWAGPKPGIDPAVEAQLEFFCSRFSSDWLPENDCVDGGGLP